MRSVILIGVQGIDTELFVNRDGRVVSRTPGDITGRQVVIETRPALGKLCGARQSEDVLRGLSLTVDEDGLLVESYRGA
jgi:hypothetical protein